MPCELCDVRHNNKPEYLAKNNRSSNHSHSFGTGIRNNASANCLWRQRAHQDKPEEQLPSEQPWLRFQYPDMHKQPRSVQKWWRLILMLRGWFAIPLFFSLDLQLLLHKDSRLPGQWERMLIHSIYNPKKKRWNEKKLLVLTCLV